MSLNLENQEHSALQTTDELVNKLLLNLKEDADGRRMETAVIDRLENVHDIVLKMTDMDIEAQNCICNCYRLCRNMLAMEPDNQNILHHSSLFDKTHALMRKIISRPQLLQDSPEFLVICRCSVQFLGNYCSGNVDNQQHIWRDFRELFRDFLHIDDGKLREYTLMVLHMILGGLTSLPTDSEADDITWDLLKCCLTLAAQTESDNGLLVVEDVLKIPGTCQHVYNNLSDSSRILLLEVLLNMLKRLPDDDQSGADESSRVTPLPAVDNIQYIAADFILQAHLIPNMTNSDNHTKALCTVKELECLCLASSHHAHYNLLQENDKLIKVAISLLRSIEDIGRQGNNLFTNAGKISQQHHVDPDHPVFGLKRDLIRLIGNLVYKHTTNQDLVRELDGIPLILNQTNIDGKNPFIAQWTIFATHNLTENNDDNKHYIAELHMQGLANNQTVLDEMGLAAEQDGDKIVVKKRKT